MMNGGGDNIGEITKQQEEKGPALQIAARKETHRNTKT